MQMRFSIGHQTVGTKDSAIILRNRETETEMRGLCWQTIRLSWRAIRNPNIHVIIVSHNALFF